MSLKALVEAVIHLESFRNIELFYQGLYFLKVRLLCDNQSGKYLASLKQRQRLEKDLANGASQATAQGDDNAKRGRAAGTEGATHSAHTAGQSRPPDGVSLAAPYCSFVS